MSNFNPSIANAIDKLSEVTEYVKLSNRGSDLLISTWSSVSFVEGAGLARGYRRFEENAEESIFIPEAEDADEAATNIENDEAKDSESDDLYCADYDSDDGSEEEWHDDDLEFDINGTHFDLRKWLENTKNAAVSYI